MKFMQMVFKSPPSTSPKAQKFPLQRQLCECCLGRIISSKSRIKDADTLSGQIAELLCYSRW